MQLEEQQAAGPADINNPYLEDTQWDMEALVLSTIAGQLEDEEEEEEKEVPDPAEEGDERGRCDDCDDDSAFGGWAHEFRSAANSSKTLREDGRAMTLCEDGCAKHSPPPAGTLLALPGAASDVKSEGSRLPSSGTALERKEQHFQMASEQGHTSFACRCHIARARGATSCLDRFGKEQFRRWHNETYGFTSDGSDAKNLNPANSIHSRMWALKEPLAGPGEKAYDTYGRKYRIRTWKLDGHEVCCHMT
jgi:hypothetical protein